MADPGWWLDPESAWWAKAARAGQHIDSLRAEVDDFLTGGSYEVVPEQGDQPGETIYRLRMSQPIPIHFSTVIGDALHNLRSALDCAACEIARRHAGRQLAEEEELACEFPIRSEPSKLEAFFEDRRRASLYGPRERQAIRAVQPAWLHDYLAGRGETNLHERSEEVAYDHLTVLNRLSNIDKHRRLHVAAWWSELVYWGSDGPSRRQWRWGTPPFKDGSVLGHLFDDPGHPEALPELHHEMELRLLDPPGAATTDIVRLLESMHHDVTRRVLPHVLNPPP